MTREEAVKHLKAVKDYMTAGNPIWDVNVVGEVFDMAIEALGEVEKSKCPMCPDCPDNCPLDTEE